MEKVQAVVIGAGVVGIACARAMQLAGIETLLVEKEAQFGSGVSSRNSGVIHGGIYYPSGSRKAALCVQGKELLYKYAQERGIDHKQCGKLVVANSDYDLQKLRDINKQAIRNGVRDLKYLTEEKVNEIEPLVQSIAGLWSPSTGIIDVHDLMVTMLGDFENSGGTYAPNTEILSAMAMAKGIAVETSDFVVLAKTVVNAAGLSAQKVAKTIRGLDQKFIPKQYLAKGNYFWLEGEAPFKCLVYPLPTKAGLGAHSLIDFNGRTRFGPDVEWIEEEDYTVTSERKEHFISLIKQYYPSLDEEKLHPDFAGIRPKIVGPDLGGADFLIQNSQEHQVTGLINLFGIESPGLTASQAIGATVTEMIKGLS
ncbi:NAD(P)/FAD-dependent oxidoreductase [Temperatibacter marinus]|uniref:NAD(P)/FAD-dependent oxidoreductase n=1 Tax=Temperatibacter marinus TaxID=1456591 RepID=A0AA52EGG5_9PROT|nr:NAD(P)/FAD-dependent oxidoreductase [Temperatibacter marinus]WND01874.1 NAD(P)/FAD-dependent oxidoreductase [Temperatibacter marinus]